MFISTEITAVSPAVNEKVSGVTEPVNPVGRSRETVQLSFFTAIKVRVQPHVPAQKLLPRLARLRLAGSPPSAGLAASYSAIVTSSTKPACAADETLTRPLPIAKGVAWLTPSSLMTFMLAVIISAD